MSHGEQMIDFTVELSHSVTLDCLLQPLTSGQTYIPPGHLRDLSSNSPVIGR